MENPFVFGTATYDEWFTDREDFYRLFAVEIIKQTSNKWEEWVQNAKHFLSSLTPKFNFGTDPMIDFSISLDFSDKRLSEEGVLNLPQRIASAKKIKIVVCIDEFQQIAEFNHSTIFQKKLRSIWQLQKQVTYCLFGSKKHLMHNLFARQSLPFYRFGDIMMLEKIDIIYWVQYIQSRFTHTEKNISPILAERICRIVDNHSSYVQQFAWHVWIKTEKETTETNLKDALNDLINQNSLLYYNYLENLTAMQISFLHALVDGINHEFTKKDVINKYNLNSSSNISRIKKSLEQKELIDIYPQTVTFNDPVFKLWLKKNVFKN